MNVADRLPLVLLADSQLLFTSDERGERFLARLCRLVATPRPRVAYLGASNGDAPEFFGLFVAALHDVGLAGCRHVPALPDAVDLAFLAQADVLMLAGGDPLLGLRAFRVHGVDRLIAERHAAGALVMGLSAGAIQLGAGWQDDESGHVAPMLALAPFAIDAHDEPAWSRLRALVYRLSQPGLGVPTGAGLLVHPDRTLEPLRRPVTRFERRGDDLTESTLAPR